MSVTSGCPFTAIAWDAPILLENATGSSAFSSWSVFVQPTPNNPWESVAELHGTFVYTGPLYPATVRLTVTQFETTSGMGGDLVSFEIYITSSVDGVIFNQSLVNPTPAGIYDWVFNLPASVGALIDVTVYSQSGFIDFGVEGTGYSQVSGTFCP